MDEWMDGWMGGWVDGWMGEWVNGWMGGWVDVYSNILHCMLSMHSYACLRIHVTVGFYTDF